MIVDQRYGLKVVKDKGDWDLTLQTLSFRTGNTYTTYRTRRARQHMHRDLQPYGLTWKYSASG